MTNIEMAYSRFSTKRFPLPSEAQLVELEQRIGVRFPEDYRRSVLEFNGGYVREPEITPVAEGCPEEVLDDMFGIGASHQSGELGRLSDIHLFDGNDPPKIVPIGSTPLGSLIILDTAPGEGQGEIYFKKAFGDFYFLAENIDEFFGLLREIT